MLMNLQIFTRKIINRFKIFIGFLYFKLKHPGVKFIQPSKIGTFYSQEGQDLYLMTLLLNLIHHRPNGWVIDVGANHPIYFSNSYAFEKFLGCKVLAIDPLRNHADSWRALRPDAIFLLAAVASVAGTTNLKIPDEEYADDMFSITSGGSFKGQIIKYSEIEVPQVRLDETFSQYGITEILLVSIDVEGNEWEVLSSIDFNLVRIYSFVIKNNSKSLLGDDQIRRFLEEKNYVFYARIGYLDDVFLHKSMINHGHCFF